MYKILVGLDGSSNSFKALDEAIKLAKFYDAELHTISVEELPYFSETISEINEEMSSEESKYHTFVLKAKKISNAKHYPIQSHILIGHEIKTIVDFIKKNKVDLLVIGFIGHSAVFDRVMGRTSQSLVKMAPCSTLVIK